MVRSSCLNKPKRSNNGQNKSKRSKKASFKLDPYSRFESRFRKGLKLGHAHLSDTECATIASRVWEHMDDKKKRTFNTDAHDFKYVYQSKNRKMNWFIQNVGHVMPGGRIDLRVLRRLASTMTNWNNNIMRNIIKDA